MGDMPQKDWGHNRVEVSASVGITHKKTLSRKGVISQKGWAGHEWPVGILDGRV